MLLNNKHAVIYGAGGHIGRAVALAFSREGAFVHLAGRTQVSLDTAANDILQTGGSADTALVDALNKDEIEAHLASIMNTAGRIDISFNAISIRGDLQGTPLIEMPHEDFLLPIMTGTKTHFLTATAAARYMLPQQSGVILTLSSSASVLSGRDRRFHRTGGFSTACAAIEGLTRSLAGELGPHGIRVVCLRPDAIPQSWSEGHRDESPDSVYTYMTGGTALGRLPTLAEVANAAVFAASDHASALTGAILNLACGSVME